MKRFFLIACFLLVSCDPVDNKLLIVNKKKESVFYIKSPFNNLIDLYNTTLSLQGIKMTTENSLKQINPGEEEHLILFGSGDAWERYIESCEGNSLKIFIFRRTELERYTLLEIADEKRYETINMTLEDLKRSNWTIFLE